MRQVPPSFFSHAFREETSEAFLALITISHPELAAPIRISTDSVDTKSRGHDFISYPVQAYMPIDEDGTPPVARLRIDNLDRDIATAIRSITTPATVHIEMVLSSDPNTVAMSFTNFQMKKATYDAMVIEAELSLREYGREPFPAWRYTPNRFRNIYRQI